MQGSWSKLDGGLAVVALGCGWLLGLSSPSSLAGAAAWSFAVFGVLYGLGAVVRRVTRADLGPGEVLTLGAVAWIAVTGPLIALGVASRGPLLVLAGVATAFAVYDIATRPLLPRRRPDAVRISLWALLALVLVVQLLGMVATRGNPFDDQVGYTALVRRLLDCGDLIEPFSFRRVSAYGGQTSLLALAALRGDVEATDLLDRGIFYAIAILVVIDLGKRRKLHPGALALVVVFVLGAWDMSINSAATWTGFCMFLAAYGFAARDDLSPRVSLALTFAACAGACTLRQNYLVPAGLFAALLLLQQVRIAAAGTSWRLALRDERRTILVTIGIAVAIVLPYMVAALISNGTFLYPLMTGTVSPDAPLRPLASTLGDELSFFLTTTLSAEPIRVWWVLAPLMVLARDPRTRRPWPLFLVSSVLGFVLLIHSFMLSDPGTLWRYAYGYMTPLAVAFVLEVSTRLPHGDTAEPPPQTLQLALVPSILVWLAVIAQLVAGRDLTAERIEISIQNVKAAVALGTNKSADGDLYRDMQAAIPAGGKVAVLIDDPYLLDFDRNEIFNLDLPGFASPAPGLPSYLGPERWRTYFLSLGIRYIAFVNTAYSTYLYRRNAWIDRMFAEGEIWRFMGARMIDTVDTFLALARSSTVLFDREGLVAIDLGTTAQPAPTTPDDPEPLRRDRFMRTLSETELGNKAWQLASRSNVVFKPDGLGPTELHMTEPMRGVHRIADVANLLTARGSSVPPYRWIADRTHVRLKGNGRHRLRIKAWADIDRLTTIPTLRLVVDGEDRGRVRATIDGTLELSSDVTCTGWCDAYLILSSLSEYWVPPEALRAAKLLELEWDKAP